MREAEKEVLDSEIEIAVQVLKSIRANPRYLTVALILAKDSNIVLYKSKKLLREMELQIVHDLRILRIRREKLDKGDNND